MVESNLLGFVTGQIEMGITKGPVLPHFHLSFTSISPRVFHNWQHDSPLEHQFDEVIFNCKKAYYEKQRELDKLREERKELVVKEKEERGRLEDKFINLIKERGKRIAFYFIEQFQNFKKKQKKKGNFQT